MRPQDAYVAVWRAARVPARRSGLLDALTRSPSPAARHLRSMFAIHDVADMASLDLAWWSYDAIAEVEHHLDALTGRARVFEYGSGASTMWLGRRAGEVHSVEHDKGFYAFLAPQLDSLSHVHLRLVEPQPSLQPRTPSRRRGHEGLDFTDYVASIDDVPGAFDLVVVDGRARVASARRALPRLAPDGLLVLDNANRDEYAAIVRDPALEVRMLRGTTPCLPYPTTTALVRPREAGHR
jgi:predicted O-methyltransferase YrrM